MTNEQPPQNPTGPETPPPGPQSGEQQAARQQEKRQSPDGEQTYWAPGTHPRTSAEKDQADEQAEEERRLQHEAEIRAREQAADARADAQIGATNRVTHQVAAEGAATRQTIGDAAVMGEMNDRARHAQTTQGIAGIIGELQQGRLEHDAAVQQILTAIVGSGNNINDALHRVEQVSGLGAAQTHALLAEISAKLEGLGSMQSPYGMPSRPARRSTPITGTAKNARHTSDPLNDPANIAPATYRQDNPASLSDLTPTDISRHIAYLRDGRTRRRRLSALPNVYGSIVGPQYDARGDRLPLPPPERLHDLADDEANRISDMRWTKRLPAKARHLIVRSAHGGRIAVLTPLNALTAAERSRQKGLATSSMSAHGATGRSARRDRERLLRRIEALTPNNDVDYRTVAGIEAVGLEVSQGVASRIANALERSKTEVVLSHDVLGRVRRQRRR